jgi:hypothetical protein
VVVEKLNTHTGADLLDAQIVLVAAQFGVLGKELLERRRGIVETPLFAPGELALAVGGIVCLACLA